MTVLASVRIVPDGLNGAIATCGPGLAELREAIRSIIQLSDDERGAAAKKAKTIGSAVFDWSVLLEQYWQLYEDLAQNLR